MNTAILDAPPLPAASAAPFPEELTRIPPRDGHCYRFGICGGPGSGKTCILTALAMLRAAHPLGHTATLVPPSDTEKKKRIKRNGEEHLTPRERGWNVIVAGWTPPGTTTRHDGAKTRILKGLVPQATRNDTNRMLLRYHMVKKDGTELSIELIDYSGELMQTETVTTELATRLRADLREMDGLLVVAAHPRDGAAAHSLATELANFVGAYALLREESAAKVPVTLLINMWDRAGTRPELVDRTGRPIPLNEESYRRILFEMADRFLDGLPAEEGGPAGPIPPHATIRDVLRGAAGEEYFASFPVSAFGPSELVTVTDPSTGDTATIERPKEVKLLDSFGLEDPFLWLVQQRDEMDLQALEAKATLAGLAFSPSTADQCKKEAARLLARISPNSPHAARARAVRRRLTRVQVTQSVTFVVALVSLILGVEAGLDARGYRLAQTAIANGQNNNGFEEGTAWFENYLQAKDYRHLVYRFVLPREKAAGELKDYRLGREGREWAQVQAAAERLTEQRKALVAFMERFPNSERIPSAQARIAEIDRELETKALLAALAKTKLGLDALTKRYAALKPEKEPELAPLIKDTKETLRELDSLAPRCLALNDKEVGATSQRIAKEANELLSDLTEKWEVVTLRKEYRAAMTEGNLVAAARLLTNSDRREALADLREEYQKNALNLLEAQVQRQARTDGGWRTALNTLSAMKSFVGPKALLADPEVPAKLRELSLLATSVGEQLAYLILLNNPDDRLNLRKFLADFPTSAMREDIQAKLDFLELADANLLFHIAPVQISWSTNSLKAEWSNILDPRIDFKVNGSPSGRNFRKLVASRSVDGSKPWPKSDDAMTIGPLEFTAQASSDPMNVTVSLIDYGPVSPDDLGSGSITTRLPNWKGGRAQTTVGAGTEYGGSVVTFQLEYKDAAGWHPFVNPELPQWHPAR
ncbi:MAG TPA: hypothetical protein VGO11_07185 [Chthoniobacteraceae bacterium]|jgi:hypothetical protein|nr:hypothetical protein [Chthoniobacteraceae bacterium]